MRKIDKIEKRNWIVNENMYKTPGNMILVTGSSVLLSGMTVLAAGNGAALIQTGFGVIYDIIAAIVSSIGALLLLWGMFEWAQSLNTQDGGAQSIACLLYTSRAQPC